MSMNLAADAAEVELTRDPLVALGALDCEDPLAVRDALLRIAALEREQLDVARLRAQIVERYDGRVKQLGAERDALRDSLKTYAETYGKVSFPDIGGIHLTTRNKGGSLRVADAVVFEDYVRATFPAIAEASTETVPKFDAAGALALVVDESDVKATPGGSIVNIVTGEDVTDQFETVGVEVVPESKSLAVRKS